jgi:hypothetical protein
VPGGACCLVSTFESFYCFGGGVLVLESADGGWSLGLSFGTLLGPEITGLLFVVVQDFGSG